MKKIIIIILTMVLLGGCSNSKDPKPGDKIDIDDPKEHSSSELIEPLKENDMYSYKLVHQYDTEGFSVSFSVFNNTDDTVIYESGPIIVDQLLEGEKQYRTDSGFTVEEKKISDYVYFSIKVGVTIKKSDDSITRREVILTKDDQGNSLRVLLKQ